MGAGADAGPGVGAPGSAGEAIELGRVLRGRDDGAALLLFEAALELPCSPGDGTDGGGCAEERPAALLEIARCQAALGEARLGLVALAGLLEVAEGDRSKLAEELRADPELEALRVSPKFEGLMKMFSGDAGAGAGSEAPATGPGLMGSKSFTQVDTSQMSPLEKALRGEWMWNLLTKKREGKMWNLVEFGDEVDAAEEQE